METVEFIRQARPEVVAATPQEAVEIKASFERMAAAPPGRFRAFLRRLSRRQLTAGIVALLLVPTGAYAVATQILDDDRSDQIEQAIQAPQNEEAARSLIEKCQELDAQGLATAPCIEALQSLDQEEGIYQPEP